MGDNSLMMQHCINEKCNMWHERSKTLNVIVQGKGVWRINWYLLPAHDSMIQYFWNVLLHHQEQPCLASYAMHANI